MRTSRPLLAMTSMVLCSSCATILTGNRTAVSFASDPPGASIVVIRGPAAEVASQARDFGLLREQVMQVISPFVPAQVRPLLDRTSPDELLTQLVLWTKLGEVPPEWVSGTGNALDKLPEPVAEQLGDLLGIEALSAAPSRIELKKGEERAVIAWQKGRHAKLLTIDTRFNWVTLLDVFTLGIGLIVDVASGAWFDLEPRELHFSLQPLPVPSP